MNPVALTIARDEDHIIEEWVAHHLTIGFDNIYIIDDQSKTPITSIIEKMPPAAASKVKVYRFESGIDFFRKEEFMQSKFYDEKLYKHYGSWKQHYFNNWGLRNIDFDSEWCYFGDCDEFIYLKNVEKISELLSQFKEYDCLSIPFLNYGTSFNIDQPNGSILFNFRYHAKQYAPYGKSFCRLKKVRVYEHPHTIQRQGSVWFNEDPLNVKLLDHTVDLFELPIHINHYITCSVKTFLARKLRSAIGQRNGDPKPLSKITSLIHTEYPYLNAKKSFIMEKYINKSIDLMNITPMSEFHDVNLNEIFTTEIDYLKRYGESTETYYKILVSTDASYLKKAVK